MKKFLSALAVFCLVGISLFAAEPHVSIRLVAPTSTVENEGNDVIAIPTIPFSLKQNTPDPFDSITTISFDIYESVPVRLEVLDAKGDTIAVLADAVLAPGEHSMILDGSKLPGGVYYYRLVSGVYTAMRHMTKNATTDVTEYPSTAKLSLAPNPSSGELRICFTPSLAGDVAIELFSANGLYTTTLFHGRCEAHEQTLVVDLDKASGSTLPSGQYWCRVVSPDGITVSPLVLVR